MLRPVHGNLMEVGSHVEVFQWNKETEESGWFFAFKPSEGGAQYWQREALPKPKPWGTYDYESNK